MNNTQDTASIAALVGAFLPLLTAVVNNPRWTSQQRQIISALISLVVGVVVVVASGNFDPQNWIVTLVAVVGAAQAAYAFLWKPTKVAPAIETATSRKLTP